MEILRKAYIVYHKGMLNENPYLGYTLETLPVTYANSPGHAKSIAEEINDYEIDGRAPKYTDILVLRAKKADEIMFEGNITSIGQMELIIKERNRIEQRRKAIQKYPEETCFYIQNGFVGNSLLFWRRKRSGYTTNIDEAELFTKKEILRDFIDAREEDIIWESKHIQQNTTRQVNQNNINYSFKA